MRKPTICLGENKGADQLRSNCEADQRLCFRYTDGTFHLLLKSEISRFLLFSVTVQLGLCRTCSETTLLVFPRGSSIICLDQSLNQLLLSLLCITKTCPSNAYPPEPHFYIAKLEYTGKYLFFLIFAPIHVHRLWVLGEAVLTCTHNQCFEQKYLNKKVQVGKDQEKAQSEKDSHSKNRGGKKPN